MIPLIDWIRGLFGIRKDIVDSKKSQLEIQKLKDEELSRNLITRASLDDVKKYDPKYQQITINTKKLKKKNSFNKRSEGCLIIMMKFLIFPALILLLLLTVQFFVYYKS